MFPEAATHIKKLLQKQLLKFVTVSAQNIHNLREDFNNLSMVIKTSMMVIKPRTLNIL